MNIVARLLTTWTHLELAKTLNKYVKENIELRNKVFALENELFWMKAKERVDDSVDK